MNSAMPYSLTADSITEAQFAMANDADQGSIFGAAERVGCEASWRKSAIFERFEEEIIGIRNFV